MNKKYSLVISVVFVFTFLSFLSDRLEVVCSLYTCGCPQACKPSLERSGVCRWIDALWMRFEI